VKILCECRGMDDYFDSQLLNSRCDVSVFVIADVYPFCWTGNCDIDDARSFGITSHKFATPHVELFPPSTYQERNATAFPKRNYCKFTDFERIAKMGSNLPCKYGWQHFGYEASYPFCDISLYLST